MKRLIALVLIALVAWTASGCEALDQLSASGAATPAPEATAEPTPSPEPTPVPTPSPTPVPVVAIAEYKYEKVSNKALGVAFSYPSHWVNVPGKITISYVQPADPGRAAARVAVSVKKSSRSHDVNTLKKELESISAKLGAGYEGFQAGAISRKTKFMGGTAVSMTYDAQLNGQPIKGYLIMTYKKAKKRLVMLHFYAPADEYDAFAPVLKQIYASVKLA